MREGGKEGGKKGGREGGREGRREEGELVVILHVEYILPGGIVD